MSGEFLFSSWKIRGRKQGAPRDPEGVKRGIPLLETPHFTTRKQKFKRIFVFSTVFHNVTDEQVNIVLCLILTTFSALIHHLYAPRPLLPPLGHPKNIKKTHMKYIKTPERSLLSANGHSSVVERSTCNQQVAGSNLAVGETFFKI